MTLKKHLYVTFAFFVLLLTACGGGEDDLNSTENAEKISASTLMKKFERNPESSESRYLGKALEVSGRITEVSNNSFGSIIFVLKTESNSGAQVMCTMLSDNFKYEPGNDVKIRGFCNDYKFNILLDKCVTID